MLHIHTRFLTLTLPILCSLALSIPPVLSQHHQPQSPLSASEPDVLPNNTIPFPLFTDLEFLSRLVDIAYCVGTSGIYPPFKCLSRCDQFPDFELVDTFNTGPLMSDSCGYVAISHGSKDIERNKNGGERETGERGVGRIVVAFRGTYSLADTIADLSSMPQEYTPYPGSPGNGNQRQPGGRKKGWMGRWWDYLSHKGSKMWPWRLEAIEESIHHDALDLQPSGRAFSVEETKCNNCTVHTGFWASWQNTRASIMPKLEELRKSYPDYRLDLMGHSLGGAVAALAGLECEALGWQPVVTTFGEPRIGNVGLREYVDAVFGLLDEQGKGGPLEGRYRRVTHVDDPVPLLPLTEWGYRPHAGEIYISKPQLQPRINDVRFCSGDADPTCIAGAETDDSLLSTRDLDDIRATGGILLDDEEAISRKDLWHFPARYKIWQLLFAHRDYFWRLGLCVPGGDPLDWGRGRYGEDEL